MATNPILNAALPAAVALLMCGIGLRCLPAAEFAGDASAGLRDLT